MAKKSKSKMEVAEIKKVSAYDIVASGYSNGSAYFAKYRLVSSILDGYKPVYRRVVIGAYEICPKNFIKSATLAGHVLGKYHPHNIDSIGDVISELVNAGVLEGDGEFGAKFLDGTQAKAASFRYTEVRLNQNYRKMFDKLLKYVPKIDGELDCKEYAYVPMPLPYVANRGSFGLGPGLSVNLPAFTMQSMVDAYEMDDPRLLKSTFGYTIVDKSNSLDRIWNTGNGSIYYLLKVYKKSLGGNKGTIIEGSAEIFTPDFSQISKWRKKGWLTMNEVGNHGVSSIFIYRNKGVTQISDDDIYNEALRISKNRQMVLIKTLAPDGVVHPVGMKVWIGTILNNFKSLLEKSKNDEIKSIEYQIKLMKEFEVVKECIIKHMKDAKFKSEDLAKETGVDLKICKDIDSWSASKLRNTDSKSEIKKLKEKLESAKKIDNEKMIKDFIHSVDNSQKELDVDTSKVKIEEVECEDLDLDEINIDVMDYDKEIGDESGTYSDVESIYKE